MIVSLSHIIYPGYGQCTGCYALLSLWLQVAELLLKHGVDANYAESLYKLTPVIESASHVTNSVTLAVCFQ